MKKTKVLLIGFILLWIVGFVVVWGVTLLKKHPVKAIELPWLKKGDADKKEKALGAGEGIEISPDAEKEGVAVRAYKVGLTDFKDDLPVMGTVKGALEIELKFEINGVVEAINFREGDVLSKGDLMASVGKKDAQLKVDYSKSKVETVKIQLLAAKKKLEIHKNLYDIGGIIKAKLEEVELEVQSSGMQVKSAEVELSSAESEFKKTDLFAPMEGVLGSRDVEVGEFVTPHDKIATLYDTKKVFVELGIVEKDIDKLALEQDVKVTVDAYPDAPFSGKVDNVFPIIEGKSRTLTVRVGIENPDALLLPGMFARAIITVAEFKQAIVIPSFGLNKTDEGYKVFVINTDNTVTSKIVQVAYVTTDYTVIESGISEGELVVIDTPQELKDGTPVDVIEVQEPSLSKE